MLWDFRFSGTEQSVIKINCERTAASDEMLSIDQAYWGDGWAAERRLKRRGRALEGSETKGLGLEDTRSHQGILSTMRQGHFWDGNFDCC